MLEERLGLAVERLKACPPMYLMLWSHAHTTSDLLVAALSPSVVQWCVAPYGAV